MKKFIKVCALVACVVALAVPVVAHASIQRSCDENVRAAYSKNLIRTDHTKYSENKDYITNICIEPIPKKNIIRVKFDSHADGTFGTVTGGVTLCITDKDDNPIASFYDTCWCFNNGSHEIQFRSDAKINPDKPIDPKDNEKAINLFCNDLRYGDGSNYKAYITSVYVND